jgi:hypothetical protein
MPSPTPPLANRPLRSLFRNNLLGLIALAVIAPGSYALAAGSSSTEAKTTRICVIAKTGTLRYVASPGHCRAGEKSFFVSRRGVQGLRGVRGADGTNGTNGTDGTNGTNGTDGDRGPQGAPGVAAPANFAEFYALMPSDNPGTLTVGSDIEFPQDGPNEGTITRASSTTFILADVGTYRVAVSASVDFATELQLMVNGIGVPYSVFGKWASDTIVGGEALITTSVANSSLTVRNVGHYDVHLMAHAGGPLPTAAYVLIHQMS